MSVKDYGVLGKWSLDTLMSRVSKDSEDYYEELGFKVNGVQYTLDNSFRFKQLRPELVLDNRIFQINKLAKIINPDLVYDVKLAISSFFEFPQRKTILGGLIETYTEQMIDYKLAKLQHGTALKEMKKDLIEHIKKSLKAGDPGYIQSIIGKTEEV